MITDLIAFALHLWVMTSHCHLCGSGHQQVIDQKKSRNFLTKKSADLAFLRGRVQVDQAQVVLEDEQKTKLKKIKLQNKV